MDGSVGLQFGLMQYLGRLSGDSPAMMVVLSALVVPLFQHAPRVFQLLVRLILARFASVPVGTARRMIQFTNGENMFATASAPFEEETSTERNNILQKAIRLYINSRQNRGNFQIRDAELYLFSPPQASFKQERATVPTWPPSLSSKKAADDAGSNLQKVMGYSVAQGPRENQWLLVDAARGVHFKFHHDNLRRDDTEGKGHGKGLAGGGVGGGGGDGGGSRKTTIFELKATGPRAEQQLDAFVAEALQHYKTLKAASVDSSRYLFMPVLPKKSIFSGDSDDDFYGKGGGRGRPSRCKRYLLSEQKTFKSLFFPEKEQVIRMLDDFLQKRGKFAIEGFPNKFGLLLHGPPGTGKTSLIKSIASYTKRHIVEVPLSKVDTNQRLFDIMFDLVFAVTGEDEALRMKFDDVIFVMEDVDAASEVVHTRSQKRSKPDQKNTGNDKKRSKDGKGRGDVGGKGKHEEDQEDVKADDESDDEEDDGEDEEDIGKGFMKGYGKGYGKGGTKKQKKQDDPDKLNLAGLLNVLDGVVDAPGRIVVMTTNHPERLDPALVRPGRVNFTIELGSMKAGPLCDLIQHIMVGEMTEAQGLAACAIAQRSALTPAQVEQSCADAVTIDEVLEKLTLIGKVTGA